ncbi:raffinose/stachyose/melibiose transport system substrate-binding protein [Gracilibacillus kekensis]|uniref:Raffinose/stachyose/melibiose transport system substrate-binding protein n=2 Tax=Gracilibacillus kekensis TaxID=1027249 RepID=A0A1M7K4K1_9BACI|nr:raffinose/stachyose/melibiose transport system substrate-binding protein [Gracilibacillus kekensis]
MITMKKMLFVLLMLAIAFALAACGGSDEESGNENAGSGEQVSIDIFQGKVEFKDQFEDLVAQYQEENPDVSISVKTVGGGTDYDPVLKTEFNSGEAPDIFNIGGPQGVEDYREYLTDLSDTKAADAALDGTLSTVKDGEEILGLPFNQEGYGLIYNKRIFEEAGINPDDLLTYEDLEKAVQTLDGMKEELGIDSVFAFPGKEGWVIGDHAANAYLSPEFDQDVMKAYQAETLAFERADEFKRFIDLQADYSVGPVLSLDYSQQVEEYFSLERVAMIQQGNWVYPSIQQMDEEVAQNIGIIPIPVEGHEGSIPVGVPNYWAVNNQGTDEEIQAAKDFLDWMYTSEAGKTAVLEDFKFIPAYEGYDTDKIVDPLSKEVYEYSEAGNTIGWIFSGYPTMWGQDALGSNIQRYLGDEATFEEAIDAAIAEWESARQ